MIWKPKRNRRSRQHVSEVKRRAARPQQLERRELLAADPIHVGVVYLETDYLESDNDVGSDSQGDRFLVSFTGGAPNTELSELRIRTDKDGDGLSVGDPMFDTEFGGRGKAGAHQFQVVRIETTDGRTATAEASVADGGQELVLNLHGFRAGDRLEFTLDVDEILRNTLDLAVFNDRLDVITSGQEFQDSILEAVFDAPHYETASADAIFLNDYGSPDIEYGLDLPPDEGTGSDSRPNRSAAAVASTMQQPKPVAIRGSVWLDNNLDAIWQNDEQGIADVELALWLANDSGAYNDTGLRTKTNAQGHYEFARDLGLMPGEYRIVQQQPDGLFSVAAIPGSVDGVAAGVASNHDVLSMIQIPLGDGEAIEMNFAEAAPTTVGGFVYRDNDNDGQRDPGESGIAGVTLRLVPINTIAAQSPLTVTTDSSGSYSFSGLAPGHYEIVEVSQPSGFLDGMDTAGTIDGVQVGAAVNPGDRINGVLLDGGDVGIEYNFGELLYGEISGYVYLAAPGQDCHDVDPATAEPLGGVIVELQRPDGNVISRVTTSPMGEYRFDSVPPGTYRIYQYTPAELLDGKSHVGLIDGIQAGIADSGTMIRQITMSPGGVGVEYNFCEISPASLSGYVYHDRSNDGVRDSNEEGIEGTTISLRDAQGAIVATTTTDSSGRYEFHGLPPGTYELVEQQPIGYVDGIDTVGTIDGILRGIAANDRIQQIELPQGLHGQDYNFGELRSATLTGTVHLDLDGDCVQDPDEEGLSGVTVRLIDEHGVEIASTQTDADGHYRFEDLLPGRYSLVQDQPEGLFDGGAMAGSQGGIAGENRIDAIDLDSGTTAIEYDFCEEPPASLAGSVHVDEDQDCIRDPNERGLQGVTIELRDESGQRVATTQTDAQGNYQFDGLRAGAYTIFEVQPEGYLQGGVVVGSAGGAVVGVDLMTVSLEPGQSAVDYLYCEIETGSISGSVWADSDQDSQWDPDEAPISEVTIKLLNESGEIVRTTKTDLNGNYRFDELPPGVYSVCQQQPDDYFHGGQLLGDAGGQIAADDLIVGIELGSGTVATAYHFPEIPPAVISGFVFIDGEPIESEAPILAEDLRDYRDGKLTTDDTPLANVTLEIRDQFGNALGDESFLNGNAAENSVITTDSSGFYQFAGLRSGIYTIFQTQPDGLTDSLDTAGSTGGIAVNAADTYDDTQRQWIASVDGSDSFDAILAISVAAGQTSTMNNFSEIIVDIVRDETPPVDYLPQPARPGEPIDQPALEEFTPKQLLFSPGQDDRRLPPRFAGEVDTVTWHLSIINGGFPRGEIASAQQFKEVAMKRMRENWKEGENDHGQWKLMTIDGEVRKESEMMNLGAEEAIALAGDFDGDGNDETAIYVAGEWFVDLNGNGIWDAGDLWILLGTEMDQPVVGDWDGDGKDDIGIFGRKWERDLHRVKLDAGLPDPSNRSRRYLENRKTLGLVSAELRGQDRSRLLRVTNEGELRADAVDHVFQFGEDVDTPVSGDWNGDGIDQIGTFRGGEWVLDTEGDGRRKTGEESFQFGQPGDRPIVGDFDGDGIDEVGVLRGNTWIIDSDGDHQLTANDQRIEIPAENAGDQAVVGDWDGDGKDEIGYYDKAG